MNEQLMQRLEELKRDYSAGEARLMELERQQAVIRETMLRISGAIQVIQELIADAAGTAAPGSGAATDADTAQAAAD